MAAAPNEDENVMASVPNQNAVLFKHLAVYVFIRIETGEGPDFNPTQAKFKKGLCDVFSCSPDFKKYNAQRRGLLLRVLKSIGYRQDEIDVIIKEGNAFNFLKRVREYERKKPGKGVADCLKSIGIDFWLGSREKKGSKW